MFFNPAGLGRAGTGGVRQARWGRQGKGKRGGVRVIYFLPVNRRGGLLPRHLRQEGEGRFDPGG